MDVLLARGLSQEILRCRKGAYGMHLIKLSGKSITQDHLDQHQALLQLLLSNDGQRDKRSFLDAFLTLNTKMERALATAAKEHTWADSEAEKLSHLWGYCLQAIKRKGFTRLHRATFGSRKHRTNKNFVMIAMEDDLERQSICVSGSKSRDKTM